jgi:hypothetical protein
MDSVVIHSNDCSSRGIHSKGLYTHRLEISHVMAGINYPAGKRRRFLSDRSSESEADLDSRCTDSLASERDEAGFGQLLLPTKEETSNLGLYENLVIAVKNVGGVESYIRKVDLRVRQSRASRLPKRGRTGLACARTLEQSNSRDITAVPESFAR